MEIRKKVKRKMGDGKGFKMENWRNKNYFRILKEFKINQMENIKKQIMKSFVFISSNKMLSD